MAHPEKRYTTAGLLLVGAGVFLLIMNLTQSGGWGFVAALGVALLLGGLLRDIYGLVVVGSLVVAVGTAVWLERMPGIAPLDQNLVFPVALGLGFLVIYPLGRRLNRWWPLLPGITLVWMGCVPFLLREAGISPAGMATMAGAWPLLLVIPGAWLLVRSALPHAYINIGRAVYIALLMMALLVVVTGVTSWATVQPPIFFHPRRSI
jgi:hypothetical protein